MANALLYQDLEKVNFADMIQQNPGDYSAFTSERIGQIMNDAIASKNASFTKASTDMLRYMDMDHNAALYQIRNQNVLDLQNTISAQNEKVANNINTDEANTKRQFEINEYFYYNKLETLFFLQIFFISILSIAIIMYFTRAGFVAPRMAGLLTLLTAIVVIIVGVTRYFYTSRTRDRRLWHRRYFPEEAPAPESLLKCGDGTAPVEINTNALLPKDVTRCASAVDTQFDQWSNNLIGEIKAFQQNNTPLVPELTPTMPSSTQFVKYVFPNECKPN